MSCELFIQAFFHMLVNIKLYHWNTTNYARHKASDELHSSLSDLTDKFIEVYIGKYKRPEFKKSYNITVKELNDSTIIDILQEYVKFLKYEVTKNLKDNDTDLLTLRDEMLIIINKTLYLFTLQ